MAKKTIRTKAIDGSDVVFVKSDTPPSGAMKYVYFSPEKDYVVAFFKKKLDSAQRERLTNIIGRYREEIFEKNIGGEFWKPLFCWPDNIVEYNGSLGIVVPAYASDFFFQKDPNRKGKEKEGKWFASAKLLKLIDKKERGNFFNYVRISLKLAQAIRRLHSAGLAHSDLSYKNVLIDPCTGKACIIDIDGLVVPGKYEADVLGTPDFIAPEVIATQHLKVGRKTPSQYTDNHALAVLIYMYLLHRHPLRGGRYFGPDVENEEIMMMGTDPLFIEHPTDHRNCNLKREYGDDYDQFLPWVDLQNFSAEKICGPYLWRLFKLAFIDGLKDPFKRPFPNDWEMALVKTADYILPCSNPKCAQQYYVYNNSKHPKCPFCGTPYKNPLPVLFFYVKDKSKGSFRDDGSRLLVWDGQSLFKWHVYKNYFPNEKLKEEDKHRVGYFRFKEGKWWLHNEKISDMYEIPPSNPRRYILPGSEVALEEGTRILLSESASDGNGRLIIVKLAGC